MSDIGKFRHLLGMDMVMDKMALDAMGMGMGMGMGMEMAAMGFGMNGAMCLDQCNMANQCCEHCHCCECQCEEVVGCNARYLCPLGVIRLAIIVCHLKLFFNDFSDKIEVEFVSKI